MEKCELKPIVESLIFVSEEPMTLDLMAMVLEGQGVNKREIREVLEEIKSDYNEHPQRGIQVIEVAGGYQFRTKSAMSEWIKRLNIPKPVRLSQAAMETLAIIAYRQPMMRSGIEEIRGVDSGGVLKTLLERGLIRIIGKSDEAGHPLLYGTTQAFLEMFTLNNLKDLPTLKEVESLEIHEKVGDLGKDEEVKQEIGEGVQEVIEEYKEDLTTYTFDPEKVDEDSRSMQNLEESIRDLRKLEKEIFPKPKEEIQVVDKATGEVVQSTGFENISPDQQETNTNNNMDPTEDETAPPQDTGRID